MYCRNCGNVLPLNGDICPNCGVPKGDGTHFCPNCDAHIEANMSFCAACGCPLMGQSNGSAGYGQSYSQNTAYAQSGYPPQTGYQPRSRVVAGVLGILLGSLGIHNFYLGFTSRGLTQLLVTLIGGAVTCGIASAAMGIWGIVEGIMILTNHISTDAKGVPMRD